MPTASMFDTLAFIRSAKPDGAWRRLVQYLVRSSYRRLTCRWWDPLIRYELDGLPLELPLSHRLPLIRTVYPHYASNLTRIVEVMIGKYPELRVIDIGANVGDSVALIKRAADCPVLCIEGEAKFCRCLRRNTARWENVELAECFVGQAQHGQVLAFRTTSPGSGQLVAARAAAWDATGGGVRLQSLAEILEQHPAFRSAGLIKIDTDGSDLQIIHDDLEVFSRNRAAIFLEYDPALFRDKAVSGLGLFEELRAVGYGTALFWDNWGDYLLSAPLSDRRLLEDLDQYYRGRATHRYADVCLLHGDDSDLAAALGAGELEFFRNYRA